MFRLIVEKLLLPKFIIYVSRYMIEELKYSPEDAIASKYLLLLPCYYRDKDTGSNTPKETGSSTPFIFRIKSLNTFSVNVSFYGPDVC